MREEVRRIPGLFTCCVPDALFSSRPFSHMRPSIIAATERCRVESTHFGSFLWYERRTAVAPKGYFHSTMLMQALRMGFLSVRHSSARGGLVAVVVVGFLGFEL